MQYASLSPLETVGSIQVWVTSGNEVSELWLISSGHLSTLQSHCVMWQGWPAVVSARLGELGLPQQLYLKNNQNTTSSLFCLKLLPRYFASLLSKKNPKKLYNTKITLLPPHPLQKKRQQKKCLKLQLDYCCAVQIWKRLLQLKSGF